MYGRCSQRPRGVSRGPLAAGLLGLLFESGRGHGIMFERIVCCQVELFVSG
jgi:hypothetical protein